MTRRFLAPAFLAITLCTCFIGPGCRTNESPEGQVDDLQITAQVKAKLVSDVGPSSVTNISVNSTNAVVTLSGQVDSADLKAKAVAIAKGVPKVSRVVDSLQVAVKPR
jgi:hyperosmotically inducible protein